MSRGTRKKFVQGKVKQPFGDIHIPGEDTYLCRASGLLKANGKHIFRAWYNQTHAYKDLNLKVVYGSLGFGKEGEEEIVYELGDANRKTFPEFINHDTIDRNGGVIWAVNLYCWLEDEEGKIYDIFESEWEIRASEENRWISTLPWREIRGKTVHEMKQNHGLHYVKVANWDTQYLLEMFIEKHFRPQYFQFLAENPRLPV